MDEDATRWDERYADRGLPTPAPPDAFAGRLDLVPGEGRALDIASGLGAQALWLAQRGLDVTALDVSPVAVDLLRRGAFDAGLGVDTRVVDLDAGLPAHLGRFDVIVCQRFRQPALYGPIVDHLTDRGVAAITVLSQAGLEGTGGPFHAPPGELIAAFDRPDVDVIHHTEADGAATIVLRRRTDSPPP